MSLSFHISLNTSSSHLGWPTSITSWTLACSSFIGISIVRKSFSKQGNHGTVQTLMLSPLPILLLHPYFTTFCAAKMLLHKKLGLVSALAFKNSIFMKYQAIMRTIPNLSPSLTTQNTLHDIHLIPFLLELLLHRNPFIFFCIISHVSLGMKINSSKFLGYSRCNFNKCHLTRPHDLLRYRT